MIESIGDFLSVAVMAAAALLGFYMLYIASVKDHETTMKNIESVYYKYYENADDEEDAEDRGGVYYE